MDKSQDKTKEIFDIEDNLKNNLKNGQYKHLIFLKLNVYLSLYFKKKFILYHEKNLFKLSQSLPG